MKMSIIEFINVSKFYEPREEEGFFRGDTIFLKFFKGKSCKRKIIALRNFSLKVSKGECVGIVGPNGAGKTTLLKLACSLLLPDKGDVIVEGLNTRKHYEKLVY